MTIGPRPHFRLRRVVAGPAPTLSRYRVPPRWRPARAHAKV